jgi:hypothetical protein
MLEEDDWPGDEKIFAVSVREKGVVDSKMIFYFSNLNLCDKNNMSRVAIFI